MRSAAAPAYWNGVAPANVMNCLAARTPATSDAGPVAQPTFQPVTLNVLPERGDRQRALGHPGQRGERDVLEPVEHQVLVDLVGDRDQVVLAARRSAIVSSSARGQHPAGRVVRRVDEDRARLGRDRGAQLVRVEAPVRRVQRHRHQARAGHLGRRAVGVIGGVEGEHLVVGLAQAEDRGGDRLGRAHRHLHVRRPRGRRSAAGARRSPARSVGTPGSGAYWLCPLRIAACAASSTAAGPSSSGKALAEIDGAGLDGQRRHLGEDRDPEAAQPRSDHGAGNATGSADPASPRRRRTGPPPRRRPPVRARRPARPTSAARRQRRRAVGVERAR